MFDIGKYLDKFKKLSESRDFLRNYVAQSIKEVCGIEIDPKNIDIKSTVARISERPIVKNEIFIKKAKVLENLAKKMEKKITDIL